MIEPRIDAVPGSKSPTRQCVILVGGFGSRLGSLTKSCPKPMLDVSGRPFLDHLMAHMCRFGFNDFVLLAGYLAEQVESFGSAFAECYDVRVRVSVEQEPAGTAGALKLAEAMLEEEFVLLNGDTMFNFNVLDLCTRPAGFECEARMALRAIPDTGRFGRVETRGARVAKMQEKLAGAGPGAINSGVYWLNRSVLGRIDHLPASLEMDILPPLIAEGRLAGWAYNGAFIDIGVPDDLAYAQSQWDEFVARPGVFFDRDGVLNEDSGYTHRLEDFRWKPGAIAAVKACNDAGRFVFVVTNQAGVARGYYDESSVHQLHHWMNADLRRYGAHIDAFAHCPHHPEGLVPEFSIACECRKPAAGMIDALADAWPVVMAESLLIGDKLSDIEAAARAGIGALLLPRGGDLHHWGNIAGVLS